jgi:hypothetical protein
MSRPGPECYAPPQTSLRLLPLHTGTVSIHAGGPSARCCCTGCGEADARPARHQPRPGREAHSGRIPGRGVSSSMRGTSGGGAPNSLMYACVHSSSDTKLSAMAHRDSGAGHVRCGCRHHQHTAACTDTRTLQHARERSRPTVAFLSIFVSDWGGRYLENLRPFGSSTMGGAKFMEFCAPQAPHPLPPASCWLAAQVSTHAHTCTRLGCELSRPSLSRLESGDAGAGARGAGVGAGARAGADGAGAAAAAAAAFARGGGMTSSSCSSLSRPK